MGGNLLYMLPNDLIAVRIDFFFDRKCSFARQLEYMLSKCAASALPRLRRRDNQERENRFGENANENERESEREVSVVRPQMEANQSIGPRSFA